MGFLRPVQFAILPVRGRLAMECHLQAFFDQTLPCAMYRRQAHADQDGDLLVRGPWPRFPFVSTQQHLGPLPRRLRHATACYQMLHRISFGTRQPHHILGFLAHVRSPAGIEIARMRNTVSEKACQFRLGEALAQGRLPKQGMQAVYPNHLFIALLNVRTKIFDRNYRLLPRRDWRPTAVSQSSKVVGTARDRGLDRPTIRIALSRSILPNLCNG